MKKLILPLILLLGGLTSCNSSNNYDYDSYEFYKELYSLAQIQNNFAMDPFNVAYRLNLYLEEGESQAAKNKLFPGKTTVETKDNQTYSITYAYSSEYPEHDLSREGRLIVHTNGAALTEENALWEIVTDPDSTYLIYIGDFGVWGMEIGTGEYVISNLSESSWNVRGDKLYLYSAGYYGQNFVNWDVNMNVSQVRGSGLSLDDARFTIESEGPRYNEGRIFGLDQLFRYEILEPLRYSAKCNYLQKSGGKDRFITLNEYGYVHPKSDTIVYDFGDSWDTCLPAFSITAKPDSLRETHYYDPFGNLLKTEREKEKENE